MEPGQQPSSGGAGGTGIIRDLSSSPELIRQPAGHVRRRLPQTRRWSWRFRMPSTHSMITRSRARRGQSSSLPARLYSFISRVPGPSAAVESSQDDSDIVDSVAEADMISSHGFLPTPRCHEGRGWSPCHPQTQHFAIYEDPSDQPTPQIRTPIPYSDSDEEKENSYGPSESDEEAANTDAVANPDVADRLVRPDIQTMLWGSDNNELEQDRDQTASEIMLHDLQELGLLDRFGGSGQDENPDIAW
ncbi:hypothetical protein PMG11_07446 [Penicillium brasilianum]|uniref:Uncharacterized protein n=1 Tax=Penicillium brasilianum TaxID=104259 RepID=A0A0F7TTQ6_PENBI|nr:hypothetical protein PMG11_07446 [Penicillium brasilianum]